MNQRSIHSGEYTDLYGYRVCLSSFWGRHVLLACGHPHAHFWGVPQTPALFLRDDSDVDDAYDTVFRISLYHIPDSASLASTRVLQTMSIFMPFFAQLIVPYL